jgi:hypothetical protein
MALLLAPFLLMGPKWHVKQVRENTQWKVPIRLTLIWDSVFDQNIGLVSTLNLLSKYESENQRFSDELKDIN